MVRRRGELRVGRDRGDVHRDPGLGLRASAPLDHVYVLETCETNGSSDNSADFGSPAADAQNGLGSATTRAARHPPYSSPSYMIYTAYCSGKRTTYKNIGSARQFQVTASPSAQGGQGSIVRYRAEVTPFALSIHGDRDESFHKGANGLPKSNTTDILTPLFGDTWVDPSNYSDGSLDPVGYYVNPSFTRELIGSWTDPFHEWNVYGKSFTDTLVDEWVTVSNKIRYTPNEYADLSEKVGGDPKVVTLRVTNDGGNGVSVNASYTLRVHHQHENWRVDQSPSLTITIAPLSAGDLTVEGSKKYSTLGADCICRWSKPSPFWDYATWATKIYGTQLSDTRWKAFFKIAEIVLPDMGGEAIQAPAGFETVWNNHADVGATITGGSWSDPKIRFGMKPRYMYEFKPKYYQCDLYGPNGYQGKGERIAAKIFKEYMSGDFYPVESLNGNGEVTL